jgi:hypothetical protein
MQPSGRSMPALKCKCAEQDRWRHQSRGKTVPESTDEEEEGDDQVLDVPDLHPREEIPPPKKFVQRVSRPSTRLKRTSTKMTQAPLRRSPSSPPRTTEEVEED